MLTNPTLDQMQALGLAGMAAAWRQLAEQNNAQELSRDEWSVYLLKKDGALVQLDLFTKKVYAVAGPLTAQEKQNPGLALGRKNELSAILKGFGVATR